MKQTIALVDDDRNILTSVAMTLEQEFSDPCYTDGEAPCRGLNARPVDLAVLDIKMHRMMAWNSLQTAAPARLHAGDLPNLEGRGRWDELMGLRLGADDYITKPFSQRRVRERLRALPRRN
jgi:two-component system response regulator ChvI